MFAKRGRYDANFPVNAMDAKNSLPPIAIGSSLFLQHENNRCFVTVAIMVVTSGRSVIVDVLINDKGNDNMDSFGRFGRVTGPCTSCTVRE